MLGSESSKPKSYLLAQGSGWIFLCDPYTACILFHSAQGTQSARRYVVNVYSIVGC